MHVQSLFTSGTVPFQYGYQIVGDLARAHILAAEVPTASGRYLITQPTAPKLSTAVKWLQVRTAWAWVYIMSDP